MLFNYLPFENACSHISYVCEAAEINDTYRTRFQEILTYIYYGNIQEFRHKTQVT